MDSILVSDQTGFSVLPHMEMNIEYGVPRKALPRKEAKVDTGHECFLWLRKQGPRFSQG